ncbi:GNAT family N-acetyltransferase [Streptomyces sp. NPDC048718]|uniref:GNAT family N-acetyltransferase n=1 Tax=Streptomyces sp. NPDC048718 TaxID=3365587 RepID=UPI003718C1F5
MDFTIRAARPEDYERLGEITVRAYRDDGFLAFGEADGYTDLLRDVAGRAAEAEVLVAVDAAETVLGGVTFTTGGEKWADTARADEAEFRMLAVDHAARGRGVGEALVRACVDRARAVPRCARIVLSTQRTMTKAHRVYARLGFVRAPERDWQPVPGVDFTLLSYGLELRDTV